MQTIQERRRFHRAIAKIRKLLNDPTLQHLIFAKPFLTIHSQQTLDILPTKLITDLIQEKFGSSPPPSFILDSDTSSSGDELLNAINNLRVVDRPPRRTVIERGPTGPFGSVPLDEILRSPRRYLPNNTEYRNFIYDNFQAPISANRNQNLAFTTVEPWTSD
ncbi:hypothetical protein QAD02_007165 [Eretmocerus hayati]|uniref:Uncharacterized protein n=1 Tax=Eretmocerus hayati TaxID=131215 RepID=A0ACC2N3H1_9HYME|nr:hypothetical protein QAD02_007165 [Eretmocerus hayati]